MKIVWNRDLEMPLGKIIAQLGHGVGAWVLGLNEAGIKDYETMRNQSKLEALSQEEFEAIKGDIVIEDRGHTVFNGVATKTVKVILSEDEKACWSANPYEAKNTDVRMVMVVKKQDIPKKKEEWIDSCMWSWADWIKDWRVNERNRSLEDLKKWNDWRSGSFAKIALVEKSEESMQAMVVKLKQEALQFREDQNRCVIGPESKDRLSPITGHLKML